MDVILNGETRTVPEDCTLGELIGSLGQAAESVASAVNGEFVARSESDSRVLQPNDHITCFQPIVGG